MMTLSATRLATPLDAGAREFVSTFMSHVATVTVYSRNRMGTLARVEALLLAAMSHGDGVSPVAWSRLHVTIDEILSSTDIAHTTRNARAYLQAFVRENPDLANW